MLMPMKVIKIAVLLTCYNRKNKTIKCLIELNNNVQNYNSTAEEKIDVHVYLTDDGCTDGTSSAVNSLQCTFPIIIIKADGNAYWAGGMRIAWKAAMNADSEYDFYLLINDDTILKENVFNELFSTHRYALKNYGKSGVYTGFVSSINDESKITYGAKIYSNSFFSKAIALRPIGTPIECSMVNANILMVNVAVVKSIGILDENFIHAAADMDYGLRARKAGYPVLTTPGVCGYCEYDHDGSDAEQVKVCSMSLSERKNYLDRPNVKQYQDSILFYWKYDKVRWLIFRLSYFLNLFAPSIYYKLYKRRGH